MQRNIKRQIFFKQMTKQMFVNEFMLFKHKKKS